MKGYRREHISRSLFVKEEQELGHLTEHSRFLTLLILLVGKFESWFEKAFILCFFSINFFFPVLPRYN